VQSVWRGNPCGNLAERGCFSGFPQHLQVYDDFPVSQPDSKCRRAEVLASNAALLLAVGSQIYRRLSGIFLHSEHTGLRNVEIRQVRGAGGLYGKGGKVILCR
jgi:hypothetical protein